MTTIEKEINSSFKSSQLKAAVNLKYTANWMSGFQNAHMKRYDLTMPQFNILRILRGAKEPLAVNTIKERMVEKSPNTTRLMDKLIDKGLIARKRCKDDRRIVFVEITSIGLNILEKIDVDFEDHEFIPKSLTDEEANLLSDLLDKMRNNYGK